MLFLVPSISNTVRSAISAVAALLVLLSLIWRFVHIDINIIYYALLCEYWRDTVFTGFSISSLAVSYPLRKLKVLKLFPAGYCGIICFSCCSLQQMPLISNSFSAATFNVYSIAACGSSSACVGAGCESQKPVRNSRVRLILSHYYTHASLPNEEKDTKFRLEISEFCIFLTKLRRFVIVFLAVLTTSKPG